MKTIHAILFLIVALVIPAIPTLTTGCAGTSERTREYAVYDTYRSVWNAAEKSYLGFSEQYVRGKVKQSDKDKADAAWEKFRTAFKISFEAASQDWNAIAPEDARRLANELTAFIATFR